MSNFMNFQRNGFPVDASDSKALTVKEIKTVEKLAYQSFVDRGYQHGHDREDWAAAEQIVRR